MVKRVTNKGVSTKKQTGPSGQKAKIEAKGKGRIRKDSAFSGGVKSAHELGIAAKSIGATRVAKTHKGRKILESRQAKVIENPKTSFFMKGRKSSETVNTLMLEMHKMRGSGMSKLLTKKQHDIIAFEDASKIEKHSVVQDCSLFVIGSHQKKRPHNLVMGRVFNGNVLDMFEFGVEDFQSMREMKANMTLPMDMKPLILFQGEPFEMSEKHKRCKNLLIDFFKMSDSTEVNVQEMQRILVFTCMSNTANITCQQFESGAINEGEIKNNKLPELKEVGPHFSLKIRRTQCADTALYKEACRKPKTTNVAKKN